MSRSPDLRSQRPFLVGVETGGTKVLCRVADGGGRILADARFPTAGPDAVVDAVARQVSRVLPPGARPDGVGVAAFGPLVLDPGSPQYGALLATPKPGWAGFPLRTALAERLQAPVVIDTDVNAAALAEQRQGAGRGRPVVAYVTVGTGIGGGLALDGVSLKGALHPEIGHLRLRRLRGDAAASACPFHRDCAEGLAAGPAVARRLGGRPLAHAPEVRALLAEYLGQLAAALVLAWSPDRIVLGGGVVTGAGLLPDIGASLARCLNGYGDSSPTADLLTMAELADAGLEGAMSLARVAAGLPQLTPSRSTSAGG